jgi:hypothetical protein
VPSSGRFWEPSQLFDWYAFAIPSDVVGRININPSRIPAKDFTLHESHEFRFHGVILSGQLYPITVRIADNARLLNIRWAGGLNGLSLPEAS